MTDNLVTDIYPKYSPDDKKIAFQREDRQIWTMNVDGTNPTQLTTPAQGTNRPGSWSPDGSQIVFQTNRTGNDEIFKMNADGSNPVNLTNFPAPAGQPGSRGFDRFPAWSPDGTKILWRSDRSANPDLWTMNPDGSAQTQLTSNPSEESGPAWSLDGKQIAFHTDRDAFGIGRTLHRNLEIYRMNADGSGPTRLTFNDFSGGGGGTTGVGAGADLTGYDLFPAWSPQGDRIVFHSGRALEFRDSGQTGIEAQWEVYTLEAVTGEGPGGSPPTRVTNRRANDESCDWQALTPEGVPTPVPGAGTVVSGTTTTGAAPSSGGDRPGPPLVELGGPDTQKLGSQIVVEAVTDEQATLEADGTISAPKAVATLRAAQRKAKSYRLPGVRVDAPARTKVTLRLQVPRKVVSAIKRRLTRGRQSTARVKVVATDLGGNRRTVLRTIRIKR